MISTVKTPEPLSSCHIQISFKSACRFGSFLRQAAAQIVLMNLSGRDVGDQLICS
jgi:hypothetical protein